ncbi:MAG: TadE/TadG family type IV pilus assembly protein [Brooklawnia sp.]|jgi:Flp pilus assembly protein TadG
MSPGNSVSSNSRSRGLVESTQWAVLIPVLLGVLFALIQGAIWLSGRSTAQQAAMAAAEHAALMSSDVDSVHQAADRIAEGGGLLDVDVQVANEARAVTVTVTGRTPALLPGELAEVSATAQRIREP